MEETGGKITYLTLRLCACDSNLLRQKQGGLH